MAESLPPLNPFPSFQGPAGGTLGFAPTPGERAVFEANSAGTQAMMQRVAMNDPMTQMVNRMMAMMSGGGKTGTGWAADNQGLATAIATALSESGMLTGSGNIHTMTQSVMQSLAHGGGSVGFGGVGGPVFNQGIPVQGPVLDHLTEGFSNALQRHFKDPVTGTLDIGRTSGLNLQELTRIMNMLSQNGAMAGRQIGTVTTFANQDAINRYYDPQIQAARAAGNYTLADSLVDKKAGTAVGASIYSVNEGVSHDMMKMTESAAKLMKLAGDITGGPIGPELMRHIERATGMSINMQNIDGMYAKYDNLVNKLKGAGVTGAGLAASMDTIGLVGDAMAGMIGDSALTRQLAAEALFPNIGAGGTSAQQMQVRAAAARGGFGVRTVSDQALTIDRMQVSAALAADHVSTALGYMASTGDYSSAERNEMLSLMEEINKETDPAKRKVLEERAQKLIMEKEGQTVGEFITAQGGAAGMRQAFNQEADKRAAASISVGTDKILLKSARDSTKGGFAGMGNRDLGLGSLNKDWDFLTKATLSLDRDGPVQQEFNALMAAGDIDGMRAFMQSRPDSFGSAEDIEAFLADFQTSAASLGGAEALTGRLGSLARRLNPMTAGVTAKGNVVERAAGAYLAGKTADSMGAGRGASGILDSFIRGALGGATTTDADINGYAAAVGMASVFGLNEQGGLSFEGEGDSERLRELLGAGNNLGYGSEAEMMKALATPTGMNKLREFMLSKGMGMSFDEKGNMHVVSGADRDKASRALEAVKQAEAARLINGEDPLTDEEREEVARRGMVGEAALTELPSLKGAGSMSEKQLKAARMLYGGDTMDVMLDKHADAIKNKMIDSGIDIDSDEYKNKAKEIDEKIRQIKEKSGAAPQASAGGGAQNLIGTIRIENGEMFIDTASASMG